ncbi:hypothetical protein SUGI_0259660 [Cryptomeria japonica]|nr:hypothetical protein SUGI_0259660 [Cryptomeria japonica]
MRNASVCIAIFSPTYAQSGWCLSELSFMLRTGTPIIPIFYDVKPGDLRWACEGRGIYAHAFLEHEKKCRYSLEKLQEWKTALRNVSLYRGEIINNDYEERIMLTTIANHVLQAMKIVPLEVAEHPVDLQEAVADFEKIICPAPLEKLRIKKLPYDVFINHRGADSRHTLVRSIYNVLGGMGLRVFFDSEELQFGDILPEVILQAMRSASLAVSIFSPRFAESPWCLAEVSFMRKIGTPIIPVFYLVQPDDLRWVTRGRYAEDFLKHQEIGRYSLEQIKEWEAALHEVSFFSGYIINNDDDVQRLLSEEQRVLKNIVNVVLNKKRKVPLVVAKHPVGLDEAVAEFDEMIESAKSHSKVQISGIWGVGGSGKTTLAKEIYNRKYQTLRRSSFLFDVRDAGVKGLLVEKQKKLLEDLGVKGATFDNVEQGKQILQSLLRSVSVLIILDDVDQKDQLDALLPTPQSLGVGSLIIVTTRNSDFLKACGSSTNYQMRALNATHAKQLFCWHAFLHPSPLSGFEDLVDLFVFVCSGLPLSLVVFGGQFYGRSTKDYWQDQLYKLSKIAPEDIKSRLRVSYDALHEEEKQMFLDIACFFIGEKKSLATAIWDGCKLHGLQRLETLMSKSLVELDQQSCIRMQGPLRDLGREIAKDKPPYRLWSSTQINMINQQAGESLQIRGIMAATTQFSACSAHREFPSYSSPYQPPFDKWLKTVKNPNLRSCPCKPLSLGLKLLVVTGDGFSSQLAKLSEELVWLRWFDFKHEMLPSWKSLTNLRVLEIYGATTLKELWEDGTHPPFKQLTELNITCDWGSGLQRFPSSISDLKCLKKIALIGYLGDEFPIKRLPEEFCDLEKLEHLELRQCKDVEDCKSFLLESQISGCPIKELNFGNSLSSSSPCLGSLKLLHIADTKVSRVSISDCCCPVLKTLQLVQNEILADILALPTSLEEVELLECERLEEISCLEVLPNLKYQRISGCPQFADSI